MLGNRTWPEWIRQYASSHQNPVNRACHTIGIPLVAISIVLAPLSVWHQSWWKIPAALFLLGWTFQFVGHWFEGKAPEFFHDWRFLFVGLRWWFAKVSGKM